MCSAEYSPGWDAERGIPAARDVLGHHLHPVHIPAQTRWHQLISLRAAMPPSYLLWPCPSGTDEVSSPRMSV